MIDGQDHPSSLLSDIIRQYYGNGLCTKVRRSTGSSGSEREDAQRLARSPGKFERPANVSLTLSLPSSGSPSSVLSSWPPNFSAGTPNARMGELRRPATA